MNEPELILADEPTGNLDSQTGDQILDHLFRLVREAGRTMVMVTHNHEVARRCHRILRLEDGHLTK
jgi:putative ABC transport system ATP-binding protein